jgi:hypothetical protein
MVALEGCRIEVFARGAETDAAPWHVFRSLDALQRWYTHPSVDQPDLECVRFYAPSSMFTPAGYGPHPDYPDVTIQSDTHSLIISASDVHELFLVCNQVFRGQGVIGMDNTGNSEDDSQVKPLKEETTPSGGRPRKRRSPHLSLVDPPHDAS